MNTPSQPPLKSLDQAAFNARMAPELDSFLASHQAAVAGHPLDKAQALKDMYGLVHGTYAVQWTGSTAPRAAVQSTLPNVSNQCIQDIAACVAGCLGIVLQAAGVPEEVSEEAGVAIVEDLSQANLATLVGDVEELASASSITDQAKAIFQIFKDVYDMLSLDQILDAIKKNMKWYDWVLIAVTVTATITAWIATDGIAAIAEIVLLSTAVAQVVIDAVAAANSCQTS